MALTLVATPGASNANAYCTLAEANTYHEAHPYASAWAGTDDQKNRAIATATRLLDEHVEWNEDSVAATSTQSLAWPRTGMLDPNGYAIGSGVIPQKLKDATAEFARWLLASNRMSDSDVETQGISALKAGAVELQFFRGAGGAKVLPDAVWYMVRQWGAVRRRGGASVPLERV